MGNKKTKYGADIVVMNRAQTLLTDIGDLQQLLDTFQDKKNSRNVYKDLNELKIGNPMMSYCQYCINMANTELLKQILDDPVSIQHFVKAKDIVSVVKTFHRFVTWM